MKWFKFYGQDWLTDLKTMSMSMEDRLCFITLLCLASSADEDGLIRGCTEEAIIRLSNIPNDPTHYMNPSEKSIGFLKRCNALQIVTLHDNGDVTVNAFARRQGENLSNAERQKNYRERLKTKDLFSNESNVTPRNDSNARIDKNRIEKNITHRVGVPFVKFWDLYPAKVQKKKAEAKWLKLSPIVQEKILKDLPLRSKDDGWKRGYIPHPTTYLNGERWEDEINQPKPTVAASKVDRI